MNLRATKGTGVDLLAAGLVGLVCAFVLPSEAMARIDEMLVTFLSIVLAAVVPGVALTASAARPPVPSPLEAKKFGERLVGQVRFWLSFLWVGALAIGAILAGRVCEWQLPLPRPDHTPGWIPTAGAWLVAVSTAAITLVAIRARHVPGAITSLIDAGTAAHAAQVVERERRLQEEVRQEIASQTADTSRGAPVDRRPRH